MIPKKHRGIKRGDIADIFFRGRTRKFSGGIVRWMTRPKDATVSRFAVTISGKIAKGAVQRNAIRRALQASIVEAVPALRRPSDVVILWNQRDDVRVSKLAKEFEEIFRIM